MEIVMGDTMQTSVTALATYVNTKIVVVIVSRYTFFLP